MFNSGSQTETELKVEPVKWTFEQIWNLTEKDVQANPNNLDERSKNKQAQVNILIK